MELNGIINGNVELHSGDCLFLGPEVHFDGCTITCHPGNEPIKIYGGGIESTTLEYGEGGTNIIASDYQIFYGIENTQFYGKWNIKGTVYASWFGLEDTTELIRNPQNIGEALSIKDNSIAINTAIKLKQMGEVKLPQGIFGIKNHIRVTSGIQLIGVGPDIENTRRGTVLYPYFNKDEHNGLHSYQIAFTKAILNQKNAVKTAIEIFSGTIEDDVFKTATISDLKTQLETIILATSVRSRKDLLIEAIDTINTSLGRNTDSTLSNKNTSDLKDILFAIFPTIQRIKLSDIPFPLHTEARDLYKEKVSELEVGYMILVNLRDETNITFIEDENSNYTGISYFSNEVEKPTRPTLTRISGIDLIYWESLYVEINNAVAPPLPHHYKGILFEGKIEIDNVRSFGLTQLCSNASRNYSDNRYIHDNTFGLGMNHEYAIEIPPNLYAFDLSGLGDALRFCGNHASSYHNTIGALKVDQCKGGIIQGNILNSDVMINRCQGITYNGNHSEYGIKLDIRGSSVSVCDNVFWKGCHPTIRIRREQYPPSNNFNNVILQNNTFVNFMRTNELSHHNISELCEYEVVTDGWANISIENCYRTRFYNNVNEIEPTGIKLGLLSIHKNSAPDGSINYYWDANTINDIPSFNQFSHLYSIQSIVCGKKVTSGICKSAFINNDNLASIDFQEKIADASLFKNYYEKPNTNIQYTIYEIYDINRRLGRKILESTDVILQNNKSFINITLNMSSFLEDKKISMLRIVRCIENQYSYVDVPICGATLLTDDGKYVNGYKWVNPFISTFALLTDVLDITYKGDNVECLIESLPILGNWQNGDIVWCESDDSQICYAKRGASWYQVSTTKLESNE